nr:hypothetical protein [uncultured Shimia sp.]
MPPRFPSLSEQGHAFLSRFSAFLVDDDLALQLQYLELRVFGSIAKGASFPSDFDVAIVYRVGDYPAARSLRKWMRENSDDIQAKVGLSLNILVLSHAELVEAEDKIGPTVVLPLSH